MVFM